METVGDRLKELRTITKMTQQEVADAIGKSKGNISGYEKGSFEPSASTIVKLSECFNISTDYILKGVSRQIESAKLSASESELISNYKKLDSRGEHKLHTVLYEELDRIDYEAQRAEREKSKTG